MKKNLVALLIAACTWAAPLSADSGSLIWGTPRIPLVSPEGDGEGVAPLQSLVIVPEDEVREPVTGIGTAHSTPEATLGYPMDRVRQQYWIGDYLPPPVGTVDWEAMQTVWRQLEEASDCVFDPAQKRFYAVRGGTITINWQMIPDGGGAVETTEQTYLVSNVGSGRPKRLYWTNAPYNSPAVLFKNSYVRIFGGGDTPVYLLEQTTDISNLTHGIYFSNRDAAEQILVAIQGDLTTHSALTGQIVVAYYDSGLYERLLGLEVVEVSAPRPIECRANIGEALQPYGGGHDVTGLKGFPVEIEATDNRGPYYYQHRGIYSYSPKNGNIYPLRPTSSSESRLLVWWKEYDAFGTAWPYECCRYTCGWGDNAVTVIRGTQVEPPGLPLSVDSTELTLELQGYQEPEGHATAPVDGTFSTQILMPNVDHYSLLKISEPDNVWFLPVRSISHTDPRYFTQKPVSVALAETCRPQLGSASGTTALYEPQVDPSLSGYLYEQTSGRNYNPLLYYPPTPGTSVIPEARPQPSTIIPVTVSDSLLEVWWSNTRQLEGCTATVTYPSFVQWYQARVPYPEEAPQIVLASRLGSAAESCYTQGRALRLDDAAASLPLLQKRYFDSGIGTIDCRFRAPEGTAGQLLTFGNPEAGIFTLSLTAEGRLQAAWGTHPPQLSERIVTDGRWHHLTFSCDLASDTKQLIFTLDGETVSLPVSTFAGDLSQVMTLAAVGTFPGSSVAAAVGAEIDTLSVWNRVIPQHELTDTERMEPTASGLTLLVTCEAETDFSDEVARGTVRIHDYQSGADLRGRSLCAVLPGAPSPGTGELFADEPPELYIQDDPQAVGYNPNEEHALLTEREDGATVAWAIRDDLTVAGSPRGVLVTYVKDGEARMRWYHVQRTSEAYPAFADSVVAGSRIHPPEPLRFLPNADNALNTWLNGSTMPFRDRKLQFWASASGSGSFCYWYELQPGFWHADAQPGDLVPWLNPSTDGLPEPWVTTASWSDAVPTLKIGQTLTTAIDGLPEVWNLSSLAIVNGSSTNVRDQVKVYDPTVRQSGSLGEGFATTQAFLDASGIPVSDKVTYRNGVYIFNNAPPGVGDRLTLDPSRPPESALGLTGRKESGLATTNLLLLNTLSETEADDLKRVIREITDDETVYNAWDAAIKDLTGSLVTPSRSTGEKAGAIAYTHAENYALTAVGCSEKDGFHLTLIENDSPDPDIVNQSLPIAMHVIKVVPELYAAPLAVRESPVNLLSPKLSILYGETFAGRASDFEFEWKSTPPPDNGVVPTDFEDGYAAHQLKKGMTDLILGESKDSLEELVNTYFAVRYRPVAGSALDKTFEALGISETERWSDWSGPALAEGWVQRVLNSITPFTQQMTDLYTNEAETAVSMIQKAGGPYQGDVALNQANLTSVGLIQLYMTILNQAERLSICKKEASPEAADQLLLAATRAADLYSVLGDEAYCDALNPTIGFGMNFSVGDKNDLGLDYGALSSGLFCFDNQVPSLLEEELALLRGRAADYQSQGLLQRAPYFNRLPWNFTRGMTGGEVAYAVNYNVSGSQSASVDAEEAARLYPQGHGDAYGHYLSAVKLYYRLLRNPNFAWGESAMGEMLLGDAVVNVDYYDEQRFSELAGALGRTACATLDRTARKVCADTGANPLAGYRDADPARGFGTGEWATKAGLGLLYNWAVGNSLLPEASDRSNYFRATFDGSSPTCGLTAPLSSAQSNTALTDRITLEFQAVAAAGQPTGASAEASEPLLFAWEGADDTFWHLALDSARQIVFRSPDSPDGEIVLGSLPADERRLLALDYCYSTGQLKLRHLAMDGTAVAEVTADSQTAPAGGTLSLARGLNGSVYEFRWWGGERSTEELRDFTATVNPADENLLGYLRTISREPAPETLDDLAAGTGWTLAGVKWESDSVSRSEIPYEDRGLNRIDRTTATALTELTRTMTGVQETMNRLDAGTNPLGLSEDAVPFDLTPIGMEAGASSHTEQLFARAESALGNAARILDSVQILGSRLRQLEEGRLAYEEALARDELALTNELIALLGTPYSDDIGGTGFYEQGYAGPDYYHYMYMDLDAYGLSTYAADPQTVAVTYSLTDGGLGEEEDFSVSTNDLVTLTYDLSADGFILKPAAWTGSRAVTGEMQQAYADALIEISAFKEALELVDRQMDAVNANLKLVNEILGAYRISYADREDLYAYKKALLGTTTAFAETERILVAIIRGLAIGLSSEVNATIVGTSTNVGSAQIQKVTDTVEKGIMIGTSSVHDVLKMAQDIAVTVEKAFELVTQDLELETAGKEKLYSLRSSIVSHVAGYNSAVAEAEKALARVGAAIETFSSVRFEADTVRKERELMRQQAVNTLTRLRYNDMFFRQVRNEALAKYEKAFDLAQRYTYLAAQAFEYETVSDLSAVRGAILGARTLGAFADDGTPLLQGAAGEGGLADILAELKADWAVLKPRLGINNPQQEVTWFSLRQELFRLRPGTDADTAWKESLTAALVPDLRTDPRYRRYCQPIASLATAYPEPALVIEFPTAIDFAKNFFGRDLAGGDSAFDPTYFATRIAAAGIYLKGYAAADGLAATPTAWLIPMGSDTFRKPGGTVDDIVSAKVIDQVVPVPYAVGTDDLNDPAWLPRYDGDFGGADSALRIRRHPSFRAAYGETDPDVTDVTALNSTRLIGRSAWNSRWMLIIPFGSMNVDREKAKARFIETVEDIRIGLRTYSHAGN